MSPRAAAWLAWSLASLRGHDLSPHPAVCPGPVCARAEQLGCGPDRRGALAPIALFGLPPGGSPDRLQTSPQLHWLDLACRRPLVDGQRHARLLQRLRRGPAWLGPLPGGDGRTKQLAVGPLSRAAWHLLDPSLPRWE